MTTIITIGNLTKDAEVKTTKDGRKYVLLQIAENIYKRDNNGKILKDENGKYVTLQTMYYSIFVHQNGALEASILEKGTAIKVIGKAKIRIEKSADNYDNYIIDSISAYSIDTDPFKKLSEADELVSDDLEVH